MITSTPRAKNLSQDRFYSNIIRELGNHFLITFIREFGEKYYHYRNEQIHDIMDKYFEINKIPIPKTILQNIFGIQRTQLDRDLVLIEKRIEHQKKNTLLTEEQECSIMNYIYESYTSYSPASQKDIINYAASRYNKNLSDGWFASFFKRHSDQLSKVSCTSIDDARTKVDPKSIQYYIDEIEKASEGVVSSLFFNIDESGHSPSINDKNYSAIIPNAFKEAPCYYKIARNEKNITSLLCISLDGDFLPPGIILPRNTIPSLIDKTGIRDGKDVVLFGSDSSYINSMIFATYFSEVIIPEIVKRRINLDIGNSPALVLMDNCSAHLCDNVQELALQFNVRLVTFPPHTSHLFQPLDLLIFSLVKKRNKQNNLYSNFSECVQRIASILSAIQRSCIQDNIRLSFGRGGIFQDFSLSPPIVRIEPQIISNKIEGQLSMVEITKEPNEDCPAKRRKSRYGFINMAHFSFLEAGICPFCFSTINSDDEEYYPETESEEEPIMNEKT